MITTPIDGCSGCATTGGAMACPYHWSGTVDLLSPVPVYFTQPIDHTTVTIMRHVGNWTFWEYIGGEAQ